MFLFPSKGQLTIVDPPSLTKHTVLHLSSFHLGGK